MKDYAAVVNRGSSKFYVKAAEKATLLAYNFEKDYPQAFEFARKWEEASVNENARFEAQLMAIRAAYQTNNSVAVGEYARKINDATMASGEQVATANYYVGKMAYDKGDFTRALPALQQVSQNTQNEMMAEAYHLEAQILFKQRKYPEAEALISDANKASAGYDDWIALNLILLSDVYADQGDKNSATAALEAVLENYNGENAEIKNSARQKYNKLQGAPAPRLNNKGGTLLDLDERN